MTSPNNQSLDNLQLGLTLSFHRGIAKLCGVNAAVIFNHILYWLEINSTNPDCQRDNKIWMYETQEDMSNFFQFLSPKEVRNAIKILVDKGLLIKSHFHDDKWKKTNWYTVYNQELIDTSRIKKVYSKRPQGLIDSAPPGSSIVPRQAHHIEDKQEDKQEDKRERESPPKIFINHGTKVRLKPGQYEALVSEFTKPVVDEVIESMNLYLDSHGKPTYKDCYSAIKNWIRKDTAKAAKPIPSKFPPKKEDWLNINKQYAQAYCKDKPWVSIDSYYANNNKLNFVRRRDSELDMRLCEPASFQFQLARLASREF